MLGDICYLLIQPYDSDPIYVTASTEGYFVNKVTQISYLQLHFYNREWLEETCNMTRQVTCILL